MEQLTCYQWHLIAMKECTTNDFAGFKCADGINDEKEDCEVKPVNVRNATF